MFSIDCSCLASLHRIQIAYRTACCLDFDCVSRTFLIFGIRLHCLGVFLEYRLPLIFPKEAIIFRQVFCWVANYVAS